MTFTPARYLLENGKPTGPNDPNRAVWYSSACWYWTDDWHKLKTRLVPARGRELCGPGVPCCPTCGSPGFQSTFVQFAQRTLPAKESCARPLTSWLGEN